MPKTATDFRFEPSQSPNEIQLHLTDDVGDVVTYRLPTEQMGRFIGGVLDILEAQAEQMKRAGKAPTDATPLGSAYTTIPPWMKFADPAQGAEEPILELKYGRMTLDIQLERQAVAALLSQALERWPPPKQ